MLQILLIQIILFIIAQRNNNIYTEKEFNGEYSIISYSNNYNFKVKNKNLILFYYPSIFHIKKLDSYSYMIELSLNENKILGVDKDDKIKIYEKNSYENKKYIIWNLIKIKNNLYIIKNSFNNKFIYENNNSIKLIYLNSKDKIFYKKNVNKKLIFEFLKLYEKTKLNSKSLKIINNEPIDVVIKYIDLADKKLNRTEFNQTYKDFDNDELRFSLRSILYYIPWVRKIFILMPNEKVKYFKYIEEINDKIIYVKDKDLLGYDSSNIQSFLFSLERMENFGISKNFIYMEDDYFIGKFLSKKHFFYFDQYNKKVYPYIISWKYYKLNKTDVINQYNNFIKINNSINAHSRIGFLMQRLNTEKFFIDNYNISIIKILFTHNALSENIDDLKEIHKVSKKYKYINETLYGKYRNVLSLCHEYFVNLYQLNINKRKVNPIISTYVQMEKIKREKLNRPLFVINTGGDHIPLYRQYKIQKKLMEKRFPFKNKYEILNYNRNNQHYLNKYLKISKIFFIFKLIRFYKYFLLK